MWFNMGIINGNDIEIVISKQSFPTLYLIKCQNKCLSSLLAQHNDHMDLTRYPICLGLLPVEFGILPDGNDEFSSAV